MKKAILFRRLSKRGAGMEMAIVTLLEIFGFCVVLMGVASLGHYFGIKSDAELTERAQVAYLGDWFVSLCRDNDSFDFSMSGATLDGVKLTDRYQVQKADLSSGEEKRFALTVRAKDRAAVLLYCECDGDGNILVWSNSQTRPMNGYAVVTDPIPEPEPEPEETTVPVTTAAPETTAEVTTDEVTTQAVTTAEETTVAVTTAAETTVVTTTPGSSDEESGSEPVSPEESSEEESVTENEPESISTPDPEEQSP